MRRPKTILLLTAMMLALAAAAVHTAREVAGPAVPVAAVNPPSTPPGSSLTPAVAKVARPPSFVSVDGRDIEFPAAALTVARTGRGLHAVLRTDDPAEAIGPGYAGNSFMFDMRLAPSASTDDLGGWDYAAATSSDATGLFLNGNREQLQPTAGVHVEFQHDGPNLMAVVSGPFLRLDDQQPVGPARAGQVYGCVRCLAADR